MFSGIRLGDTYLNVYDLYRLRLRADLVTLSGCATGANVAAAGDELLGITRGLFCAGAHTLLLSLWNVHDESTAALMTRLYRRLRRECRRWTRYATRCANSGRNTHIRTFGRPLC